MKVITIESKAFKELSDKIESIAAHIKRESNIHKKEVWLTSQEVAEWLRVSTKTVQRLRKEKIIPYTITRGRCLYKLSDIEKSLNDNSVQCTPRTLDDLHRNYTKSNK